MDLSRVPSVTAVLLASLLTASCASLHPSPEQVASSNPTVTYKYRSDKELIETDARASAFCSQYQLTPHVVNYAEDADGSRIIVYECVPLAPPPMPAPWTRPPGANLTYTYWTDQELMEATRSAHTYCTTSGSGNLTSNITTNPDGSKTVTFYCS